MIVRGESTIIDYNPPFDQGLKLDNSLLTLCFNGQFAGLDALPTLPTAFGFQRWISLSFTGQLGIT